MWSFHLAPCRSVNIIVVKMNCYCANTDVTTSINLQCIVVEAWRAEMTVGATLLRLACP